MRALRLRTSAVLGDWLVLLGEHGDAFSLAALRMDEDSWWIAEWDGEKHAALAADAGLSVEELGAALGDALGRSTRLTTIDADEHGGSQVLARVRCRLQIGLNGQQHRMLLQPASAPDALRYATIALTNATQECAQVKSTLSTERKRYRALIVARPTAARYARSSLAHPGVAPRRRSPGAFED